MSGSPYAVTSRWNRRTPPLPTREEVEATIRQHLRLQWTGSHFSVDARSITISADAMLRMLRGEGL
jgi:hypothetical protein